MNITGTSGAVPFRTPGPNATVLVASPTLKYWKLTLVFVRPFDPIDRRHSTCRGKSKSGQPRVKRTERKGRLCSRFNVMIGKLVDHESPSSTALQSGIDVARAAADWPVDQCHTVHSTYKPTAVTV